MGLGVRLMIFPPFIHWGAVLVCVVVAVCGIVFKRISNRARYSRITRIVEGVRAQVVGAFHLLAAIAFLFNDLYGLLFAVFAGISFALLSSEEE